VTDKNNIQAAAAGRDDCAKHDSTTRILDFRDFFGGQVRRSALNTYVGDHIGITHQISIAWDVRPSPSVKEVTVVFQMALFRHASTVPEDIIMKTLFDHRTNRRRIME
jgi:hypothetical protein